MSQLLKPFEFAINQALQQDPDTYARLSSFEQRTLIVNIDDFHRIIRIHFSQQKIQLSTRDDEDADLLIKGKALALLKLGQHPDDLFSAGIIIHGDVSFAKQLRDLLEQFDFDWEQQLARVTGDTLAYPLAQGIRKTGSWIRSSHASLQLSTAEYLREEVQLLPDKSLIIDYLKDIDQLRADVDRIEARINRLQS